jgi:hypothetical protein
MIRRHIALIVLIAATFTSCQYFGIVTEKPEEEQGKKEKNGEQFEKIDPETYNPSDYSFQEQVVYFLTRDETRKELGRVYPYVRIDSIHKDDSAKTVEVFFNKYLSYLPFREQKVDSLYSYFSQSIDTTYHAYDQSLITLKKDIRELIPNIYRSETDKAPERLAKSEFSRPQPVVRPLDKPYEITKGLYNHPVALWHSHGWYYNSELDRWLWQRARLFGTVEDLYPMSITVPYLIPMLENAGSNVFVPRERDVQTHEIVVDNDGSDGKSRIFAAGTWRETDEAGFAIGDRPYKSGHNPFEKGTAQYSERNNTIAELKYSPDIPEKGEYAVYISYQKLPGSTENAHYTVRHSGGETSFLVNQQIGGQTWIYLGTFLFDEGRDSDVSAVIVSTESAAVGEIVSSDAVRFGGGMGVIERGGDVSGRPKFTEGARYWMQYAGMPQDEVYQLNENNDYNDDYQGRGEWVNYLMGAPFGPNKDRDMEGLGIPVDASMAFHTDAGVTTNDTTVGTLMIYSIEGAEDELVFPDSVSRYANRDYADIVQSQLVDDIRAKYDDAWTRRNLYDAGYSEAFRQNTPSILIELLSHQNFFDMKFGLDPQFKFDVARSIYKGTLKFIAQQYGQEYVVQPLPVSHMNATFNQQGEIVLNWKPTPDSLEPTATADGFMVYTRVGEGGFDNGVLVEEPRFVRSEFDGNRLYSFKVNAVNTGGESMDGEVITIGTPGRGKSPVMVVNGFDRVSAPEWVSEGNFEGFVHFQDRGVSDGVDVSFIGDQYNFEKGNKWVNDDEPGHGASRANLETIPTVGNTHDNVYIHARAILDAGYPVVSSSDEAVMDNYVDLTAYKYVDLILGEEKATAWQRPALDTLRGRRFETFPLRLRSKVKQYLNAGGNLFASGAYVATDLFRNPGPNPENQEFAEKWLQFTFRANYASETGKVESTNDGDTIALPPNFRFNAAMGSNIYQVEAADALVPVSESGKTILRYTENKLSAGTMFEGYYKSVITGFPFETIDSEEARSAFMKSVLQYFDRTVGN